MRRRVLLFVVAAAVAAGGYAFAANYSKQAHGSLRSQPLVEGCTSPVGFCTTGQASGTINGDFVFTATRFVPSDMPGVVLVTGEIVFQTSRGEVRCEDAGAYNSDELDVRAGAVRLRVHHHRRHGSLGRRNRPHPHPRHLHARRGRQRPVRGIDLALSPACRRCLGPSAASPPPDRPIVPVIWPPNWRALLVNRL